MNGVSRTAAVVATVGVALGGCDARALPLPGGAPDGPAYRVTIEFADVLDLVPRSAVKVNDVTVGSVEKIWLSGWTARVRVSVSRTVRLPDNATAAIRQTSLLGEKFVALAAPGDEPAHGTLSDGDVIGLTRTRRGAEVEEVLAALGLLLNGGGLAQLRTINEELANALHGREDVVRDVLHQLDLFFTGLDAQRTQIVRAIEALDRLSARLAAERDTIGAAVDALGPGLDVLASQRVRLTDALTALGELGTVGTRVVNASRDDTLASLAALRPILDQLVRAGTDLPRALDFLLTFPFPPNVTGAIVGDAVNLHATADFDAADILANLLTAGPTAPGSPAVPGLPGLLPGLPGGPALPPLPGLPTLPPLPVPSLPCLPTASVLPSLPGLPLPTLPSALPSPSLPPCTPLPGG